MRACNECGNWFPDAQESCPKCGTAGPVATIETAAWPPPAETGLAAPPLPPSPAPSGSAPIAPESWGPPATPTGLPPAPAPMPPPVAAPPAAPPVQWAPPTGADPPPSSSPPPPTSQAPAAAAPPAATKKSGARAVWISLAAVVAVVIVGAIGIQLFVHDDPPSALGGYVSGKGTAYSFPQDRVAARVPRAPSLSNEREKVGGRVYAEARALIEQPTYGILYVRLTPAVALPTSAAKLQAIMHPLLLSENDDLGVKFTSTQDTTINGHPAIVIHGSYKGDQSEAAMVFANGKFYGFFVHTKSGAAKVLAAFDESFRAK